MAVELPEPLQWVLLLLAGCRWPEADEDQLRDMADHCRKAAESLQDATQGVDTAIKSALEGQQGDAAEALNTYWAGYTVGKGTDKDPGRLTGTIKALSGMGDMLEQMANSTETAKIQIVAQLGILAFELATAEAEAPVTAGASMLQVPAFIAAARTFVKKLLDNLLGEMIKMAAKQAAQMAAINLMAQGIELAEGHRKSIDWKEVGENAKGGAIGGAAGHLIGKGLGGAAGKVGLGGAANSLGGKMAIGAATGVGADAATQFLTTGKVDPSSLLGSGLSGGAGVGLHHGAVKMNGGHSPAPKPGDAPHMSGPVGPGEGGRQDGPPKFTKPGTSSGDGSGSYQGPSGDGGSANSGATKSRSDGWDDSGPSSSDSTSRSDGRDSSGNSNSGAGHTGSGESKVGGLSPFGNGRSGGDAPPSHSEATGGKNHADAPPTREQATGGRGHEQTPPSHEQPGGNKGHEQAEAVRPMREPVADQAPSRSAHEEAQAVRPEREPLAGQEPGRPVHEQQPARSGAEGHATRPDSREAGGAPVREEAQGVRPEREPRSVREPGDPVRNDTASAPVHDNNSTAGSESSASGRDSGRQPGDDGVPRPAAGGPVPNLSGVLGGAAHLAGAASSSGHSSGSGGTHLDGTRGATLLRPSEVTVPGQGGPDGIGEHVPNSGAQNPNQSIVPPMGGGGGFTPGPVGGGVGGSHGGSGIRPDASANSAAHRPAGDGGQQQGGSTIRPGGGRSAGPEPHAVTPKPSEHNGPAPHESADRPAPHDRPEGESRPPANDKRPIDRPGGLKEPTAHDRQRIADAVPRDENGTPKIHPNPLEGDWVKHLNGDGFQAPGRSNNCADAALSFLDTYNGHPTPAAPRVENNGAGEKGGRDRIEQALGGRFEHQGDGDAGHANLRKTLLESGPGSQAVIISADAQGRSHAWNVVNQDGRIVYVDPQMGRTSEKPLYAGEGGLFAVPVKPDGSAVHPVAHPDPIAHPDPVVRAEPQPTPETSPVPGAQRPDAAPGMAERQLPPLDQRPTPEEKARLHRDPEGPALIYPSSESRLAQAQHQLKNTFKFDLSGDLNTSANALPHTDGNRHHSGSFTAGGKPDVKVSPYSQTFKSHLDPLTLKALHSDAASALNDGLRKQLVDSGEQAANVYMGNKLLEESGKLDHRTKPNYDSQAERRNVLERLAHENSGTTWHPVDGARVRQRLDGQDSALDGVRRLFHGDGVNPEHPGMVLGETHGNSPSWGFLKENMAGLKEAGVDTIYIEALRDDSLQHHLDSYLENGGVMPPNLERMLRSYDRNNNSPADAGVYDMVVRARAEGVRVHAVDGYPARKPDGVGDGPLEQRARLLNSYMHDAITGDRVGRQGKYILVTGTSHVHEHGTAHGGGARIPGVAEMLGAPPVHLTTPEGTKAVGSTLPDDIRLGHLPDPRSAPSDPAGIGHSTHDGTTSQHEQPAHGRSLTEHPAGPRHPATDERPYDVEGGLKRPSEHEQQQLQDAVPHHADGTPQRHPDPMAGDWVEKLNGDGVGAPGRANNCADAALSVVDTYDGRPAVAASRTEDNAAGEKGSRDRIERSLGAKFENLGAGDAGHAKLRQTLLDSGPGSQAVIISHDADGRSHAWNAMNHDGRIVYVDGQLGRTGDEPLYRGEGGLFAVPLTPDRAPLHPDGDRSPAALRPDAAPGALEEQLPSLPTNPELAAVDVPPRPDELAKLHQQPPGPALIYPPAHSPEALAKYKSDNKFTFRLTGRLGLAADGLPHNDLGRRHSGVKTPDGKYELQVSPYSQSIKSHLDGTSLGALNKPVVAAVRPPVGDLLFQRGDPNYMKYKGNAVLAEAGRLDFRTLPNYHAQLERVNVLERLAHQHSRQTWHPVDGGQVHDRLAQQHSALDGVDRLLGSQDGYVAPQGIVLGEGHSESPSWKFLKDNMAGLKNAGVDTIYVEAIRDETFQRHLDDYLKPGGTMPDNLETMLKEYDKEQRSPVGEGVYDMVLEAKARGMRVRAADGFPARTPVDGAQNEQRARLMNSYTYDVIQNDHGRAGKFVAVVGASHVLEHSAAGGAPRIPGLSEMLGAPPVRLVTPTGGHADGATPSGDLRLGLLVPNAAEGHVVPGQAQHANGNAPGGPDPAPAGLGRPPHEPSSLPEQPSHEQPSDEHSSHEQLSSHERSLSERGEYPTDSGERIRQLGPDATVSRPHRMPDPAVPDEPAGVLFSRPAAETLPKDVLDSVSLLTGRKDATEVQVAGDQLVALQTHTEQLYEQIRTNLGRLNLGEDGLTGHPERANSQLQYALWSGGTGLADRYGGPERTGQGQAEALNSAEQAFMMSRTDEDARARAELALKYGDKWPPMDPQYQKDFVAWLKEKEQDPNHRYDPEEAEAEFKRLRAAAGTRDAELLEEDGRIPVAEHDARFKNAWDRASDDVALHAAEAMAGFQSYGLDEPLVGDPDKVAHPKPAETVQVRQEIPMAQKVVDRVTTDLHENIGARRRIVELTVDQELKEQLTVLADKAEHGANTFQEGVGKLTWKETSTAQERTGLAEGRKESAATMLRGRDEFLGAVRDFDRLLTDRGVPAAHSTYVSDQVPQQVRAPADPSGAEVPRSVPDERAEPDPQRQAAADRLAGYLGGGAKVHPPMSNTLLGHVNPDRSELPAGATFGPGAELTACLQNVEAYRDTHFGRPRVGGSDLSEDTGAAGTRWMRPDAPAAFGRGDDAVKALMERVQAGGKGSFATVLAMGEDGRGRALALVHDRDGALRWADLAERRVSTATGATPRGFHPGWAVWAAVDDPEEKTLSGPPDPLFTETLAGRRPTS